MTWLRVAIDAPLRRLFDYEVPDALCRSLRPGTRVRVPFGRRQVVGWVAEGPRSDDPPGFACKPVTAALDEAPLLPPELLTLLRWTADYYQHPVGEVFATALPAPLRRGQALPAVGRSGFALTADGQSALGRLPGRASALRALLTTLGAGPRARDSLAVNAATLRRAVAAGWVTATELPPPAYTGERQGTCPELSTEQAAVLAALATDTSDPGTTLLEGVTGSGKTEIYLRRAADLLARGRQVLVLVPEIGLTPQLAGRFVDRFGAETVASYHSGLSDLERARVWRAACEGRAGVIVGTRSAVFLALAAPGLIIVDEEHDLSFKQQDGLRYSARDIAVLRGRRLGVPVLLGSATPALESLHNARSGRYRHLRLQRRVHEGLPPRIALLDVRHQPLSHGLSEPLLQTVQRHLTGGSQGLLFLNRRGYAPVLLCHDCGRTAPCPNCDARLVVHRARRQLACHHCGLTAPIPDRCEDCGGTALVPVGQGTERIEDALRLRFPAARIERIDADRLSSPARTAALFTAVRNGQVDLLVGTQVLAKGHDFPRLGFAGLIDVDQALFGSDFRAIERMGQLVTQVAGRVGRAGQPGEVLLQTHQPGHPLLRELVEHGYPRFAETLLAERATYGLPPFAALALLRAEARDEADATAFVAAAQRALPAHPEVAGLGPAPATMARRAGYQRVHLLLKSASRAALHRCIAAWLPRIEALPGATRLRWSLDIDPADLH